MTEQDEESFEKAEICSMYEQPFLIESQCFLPIKKKQNISESVLDCVRIEKLKK